MSASLLHYRAWQGSFRSPIWSVWPIARVALGLLLSRKLFWLLYASGLLLFLMFFFGWYLFVWAETRLATAGLPRNWMFGDPQRLARFLREGVAVLNGSRETYRQFFSYQGAVLVITLSLAGAVLVGNDFVHRSLVFYLSKPIGRWHYLLGKCLAVGVVVHMLTTLPALALYVRYSFADWEYLLHADYFTRNDVQAGPGGLPLLLGVVGYGMILAVFLSVLLVATASWMRRTMPLIMVWISLFFFPSRLAEILVDVLNYDVHWRLLDLWNNLRLLGQACLGVEHARLRPEPQPEFWQAGLVLAGVTAVCLIWLNRRTRAVEVVS